MKRSEIDENSLRLLRTKKNNRKNHKSPITNEKEFLFELEYKRRGLRNITAQRTAYMRENYFKEQQ